LWDEPQLQRLSAALNAVPKRRYEPTILDCEPTPIDLRICTGRTNLETFLLTLSIGLLFDECGQKSVNVYDPEWWLTMADRKQFYGEIKADPELLKVLEASRQTPVTEVELREQRISFAFGNAPADAKNITKDSVRRASEHIRLLP
jgi:hypothetical protein